MEMTQLRAEVRNAFREIRYSTVFLYLREYLCERGERENRDMLKVSRDCVREIKEENMTVWGVGADVR
jgi:hypothetical protein